MLTVIRTCGIIVLTFTVGYLLFAVLPFYGNGIHLHTSQEIAGSFVDVKGYPPFVWLGGPAQAVAMYSAGFVRQIGLLVTPVLLVALALGHRSLRRTEGVVWLAAVVLNTATLALTWRTVSIINTWLVD